MWRSQGLLAALYSGNCKILPEFRQQRGQTCVPNALRNYLLWMIKDGILPEECKKDVLSMNMLDICERYDPDVGCSDGGMYIKHVWNYVDSSIKVPYTWKGYDEVDRTKEDMTSIVTTIVKNNKACIVGYKTHAFLVTHNNNGKLTKIDSMCANGMSYITVDNLRKNITAVCYFE